MKPSALTVCLAALLMIAQALHAQQTHVDRVVAAHYPPLMIDGAPGRPGYAIDVLQEAARRAGRSIDLQFLPFQRAVHEILTDDATLMPALFKGKAHDDQILWVVEYHRTGLSFASLSNRVDTIEQARDLSAIVVERGTTSEQVLSQLGFDNLQYTRSPQASANMLASGRADAWLLTEDMMRMTWSMLDMDTALSVGSSIRDIPVFLVASPALPDDTRRAYQTAINAMRNDGTLARLLQRYQASAH
ncbi:transporter substrate-binding domain-containing protein [Tateyamaria omphalii]|uniref:substrate-binding periplasmic protein n=1 Tax=Tateyamaria omphalii TaxID=299262 RepID=UPI001C99E19D|nr:transporter substrate-binding domain-containing protein [Tateyamaria omphalii]MBY5931994.1 transporter substrate-binding domain-containing protein [Tateyamaria omphalii]